MVTQAAPAADVRSLVDQLILGALREKASDLHLEPLSDGCELRCRGLQTKPNWRGCWEIRLT
ncbi:MAG: hypothetical protein ABSF29_12445 [Tepidisphaeraceae bacterium]